MSESGKLFFCGLFVRRYKRVAHDDVACSIDGCREWWNLWCWGFQDLRARDSWGCEKYSDCGDEAAVHRSLLASHAPMIGGGVSPSNLCKPRSEEHTSELQSL